MHLQHLGKGVTHHAKDFSKMGGKKIKRKRTVGEGERIQS